MKCFADIRTEEVETTSSKVGLGGVSVSARHSVISMNNTGILYILAKKSMSMSKSMPEQSKYSVNIPLLISHTERARTSCIKHKY